MTIDEEYKGCRNCKYQPEPLQTCDWLKHQKIFYKLCPMWELKEGEVKMTIDEAIGRLSYMKNKVDVALMKSKYEKGHWLYDDVQGTADALQIAINALEKQIPKKLIRRRATDDDVENELRDFITRKGEICRCPACGDCIAIYELKYCMECGQKLDWESDEV